MINFNGESVLTKPINVNDMNIVNVNLIDSPTNWIEKINV